MKNALASVKWWTPEQQACLDAFGGKTYRPAVGTRGGEGA